jgi:catechol 2,3-dioxygenase-like lactoylglutathione lyase family enzyme
MGKMAPGKSIFNHVGLTVTDLQRSKAFYEQALGFVYWWELEAPDEGSSKLLQLEPPLDLKAVYLVRDGFVLELLHYNPDRVEPWRKRSMAEPGLTHISLTVDDLETAMGLVEQHGGKALRETDTGPGVMVRDPDGQLIELLTPDFANSRPPLPA